MQEDHNEKDHGALIIYIHGGLNFPSNSVKNANNLTCLIEKNGYKPFFIHWRSGAWTTYKEHLLYDRQGQYYETFGPLTMPFILAEDLGRGLTRAPMRLFQNINNYGKSLFFGKYGDEKIALNLSNQYLTEENQHNYCDLNRIKPSNKLKFGELPTICDLRSRPVKFFDGAIDLGALGLSLITVPVFDVVATSSWSTMKRRTEIMFTKRICYPSNNNCDSKFTSIEEFQTKREGVATKFFNALQDKQQKNKDIKIILVGHSMGTIIANKILRRWPKIEFSKIIYLGAATSIEDFNVSVMPYMEKHPDVEFYNISLHPIAENTEIQVFGLGQTGSLLTQIDNHYESHIYENNRTLGRWTNIVNNMDYFNKSDTSGEILKRMNFRALPFAKGFPKNHGDFDNPEFIKNGRFWVGEIIRKPELKGIAN